MIFVKYCAEHFINHEIKEVRLEAASTCSKLLSPIITSSMKPPGQFGSPTVFARVSEILEKLLVVGITDPSSDIR